MAMTWARPHSCPTMHAVAHVVGVIALAHCPAAFVTYDVVEIDEAPVHAMRCPECVDVLVDRRCAELGLTELMEATLS